MMMMMMMVMYMWDVPCCDEET
jgi:hypothetical protein